MENIKYACRYLLNSRSGNIIRIVSLMLGLTVCIIAGKNAPGRIIAV